MTTTTRSGWPMPKDHGYVIYLTPSQRMALIDCITSVMTGPARLEVFVDVIRDVETTPGDLLRVILHARPDGVIVPDRPLHYILNAAGEPEPCETWDTWAAWYATAHRSVAQDIEEEADGWAVRVSTDFLGRDQRPWLPGPPILWETRVFGGVLHGEARQYASRADALAGHQAIREQVRATRHRKESEADAEEPERPPRG